jgi:hypothetical protein
MFLHAVGSSWISVFQNQSESSSDDLQLPEKHSSCFEKQHLVVKYWTLYMQSGAQQHNLYNCKEEYVMGLNIPSV